MKNRNLLLMLFLFICQIGLGQETADKAKFDFWIYYYNNERTSSGYLNEVKDSSLVFISQFPNYTRQLDLKHEIDIKNIKSIKYRRKGKAGRSLITGTLIGLGAGVLIGYSGGDDVCNNCVFSLSKELKATGLGIVGGLSGAIIGGVIGSMKVEIPIHGRQKLFTINKNRLSKLTF